MSGIVPNWTPPYWPCCDVYGAPGDTVCWACPDDAPTRQPAAKGPPLHHSAGTVLRHEFPDDLPEVDHLMERT